MQYIITFVKIIRDNSIKYSTINEHKRKIKNSIKTKKIIRIINAFSLAKH